MDQGSKAVMIVGDTEVSLLKISINRKGFRFYQEDGFTCHKHKRNESGFPNFQTCFLVRFRLFQSKSVVYMFL